MRHHALLAAAVLASLLSLTGCAASASTPSAASNPNAIPPGSIRMPDFVGQTAGMANEQLRAALGDTITVQAPGGDTITVQAPGGDAAANQTVASTDPPAGTIVNTSTTFELYTSGPAPVVTPSSTTTTEPPITTTDQPTPADDSGSSGSGSGGSVDVPYVPHPHVHACVGGKHIHVCS